MEEMKAEKRKPLILAPGVSFNEEAHTYHLNGKQLSGVTRVIGSYLGTKMPAEFVGEARDEGLHVHRAIEEWIDTGCTFVNSIHPGVTWMVNTLLNKAREPQVICSEVLVSDLHTYASPVDIITIGEDGLLELWDMKRTFKRPSVTWQLSIYKYLIERYTTHKVGKMWCAAFRDYEYYPVFAKSPEEVEGLLYAKKGGQ
jgi:hypothetical protein